MKFLKKLTKEKEKSRLIKRRSNLQNKILKTFNLTKMKV
jgi:hypothetical protein